MTIEKENVLLKNSIVKNNFKCNRCGTDLLQGDSVCGILQKKKEPDEKDILVCPVCGHTIGTIIQKGKNINNNKCALKTEKGKINYAKRSRKAV